MCHHKIYDCAMCVQTSKILMTCPAHQPTTLQPQQKYSEFSFGAHDDERAVFASHEVIYLLQSVRI